MTNIAGIGLANGPQDIQRVQALGCDHYLALEMQINQLAQCQGQRYIRMWHKAGDDPIEMADAAKDWLHITPHIIPWNEANIETNLSYRGIADAFDWTRGIIGGDVILHWPGLAPKPGYREAIDDWRDAANSADVIDLHAYGSCAQILEIVDWYHSQFPTKELLLTEVNAGAGNVFDQEWWAREFLALLAALVERPWVIAAIGFIWEWQHPDMHLPVTVDWINQPIERRVKAAIKPQRRPWQQGGNVSTVKIGNLEVVDLRGKLPTHPTLRYEQRSLGGIQTIVIHHSATPGDATAETIAAYHVNSQGWPGIAYHFLVHQDGRTEYCQPIEIVSYGVARRNEDTMHICLPGDWTASPPPEAQLAATKRLIDNLDFALGIVYPVVGHSEIAPSDYATSCPGATWPTWRSRLVTVTVPPPVNWEAKCHELEHELANERQKIVILKSAIGQMVRTGQTYL